MLKKIHNIARKQQSLSLTNNLKAFSSVRIPQNHNLHGYIQQYQRFGHLKATLDPLGLKIPEKDQAFELEHWQLNELEAITSYPLDYRIPQNLIDKCHTIKDVEDYLNQVYSSNIGVEFEHVHSEQERLWLYENHERVMHEQLTPSEKIKALQLLVRTEEMEKLLQKRFATHKRYSSEGSEAITVALNTILGEASLMDKENPDNNLEYAVLGMPHRGRLATLVVINDYPFRNLLYKVKGNNDIPEEIVDRIDDIPTHIAVSNSKKFSIGGDSSRNNEITMTMVHNPSHLESQNSVSMGKTKAKQDDFGGNWRKVLNLQGHGDAAFTGQGAAYEALTLCKLPKFTTNGCIHFITNNQVGFTTDSKDARSFPYASDIVKPFGIPIIRVNAGDPESVVKACKLAVRYWQQYGKDVLLDMIGYRKYGHNEVDEPAFTQPKMYEAIRRMQSLPTSYGQKLIQNGTIKEAQYQKIVDSTVKYFEDEFVASQNIKPSLADTRNPAYKGSRSLTHKWSEMDFSQNGKEPKDTGYDKETLQNIIKSSVEVPEGVKPHNRLERFHIQSRLKTLQTNDIDWATAEAMAFGSLVIDGFNVRLTGEDVERGTFNHRHAVLHDSESLSGNKFTTPLKDSKFMQSKSKGRFQVYNTNLNELGIMGYEYGYSLENPKNLCLWEAQFGDFYNPAQLIVDQYLMCSEAKWLRQSGLILLLPHGFEGAGPEHSTCHIERFLQNVNSQAYDSINGAYDNLTGQNINFQVAQVTMPSNYFHLLRRHMLRNYRKPLILATPKIGLKHPKAVSPIEEFLQGTTFQPAIVKEFGEGQTKKVVFCSGKIYFDIMQKFEQKPPQHKTAVIRIEELAPFPIKSIEPYLQKVGNNADVFYAQDECMNEGAFQWAKIHIDRSLKKLKFKMDEMGYIGRPSQHSFATGASSDYKKESDKLWNDFEKAIY